MMKSIPLCTDILPPTWLVMVVDCDEEKEVLTVTPEATANVQGRAVHV